MLSGCGVTESPTPIPTPTPTPTPETALYVETTGSDENNGSKDAPFKTVQRAIEAVRALVAEGLKERVTVYIHKGDYNITNIVLTEADSGTRNFP